MTRSARNKSRAPRVRLTHLEVRSGTSLRLRLAIADEMLAEASEELGELIKRISPRDQPEPPMDPSEDFIITRAHSEEVDSYQAHSATDVHYHARVREQLSGIVGTLCDASLDDAIDIVKAERARRARAIN